MFKDTLREDVPRVFVNADEFATEHDIDGKKLLCVFDEGQDTAGGKTEGIFIRSNVLFVQESFLPKKPIPGARMRVDGTWYLGTFVVPDNFGMCEIHLERNQQ